MNSADRPEQSNKEFVSSPTPAGPFARLVFRIPDGRFERKDILKETTLIGSANGSNIQLVSQEISPAHCIITLESGVLRLRALRSQAGTKVNGQPVEVCTLCDGDKLQFGAVEFSVETNLSSSAAIDSTGTLCVTDVETTQFPLQQADEDFAVNASFDDEQTSIQVQPAEVDYARLVFPNRENLIEHKNILRPTTLIGSSRECNIRLLSPEVSEAHCVITLESRTLKVRDLRSRIGTRLDLRSCIGTRLNGEPISIGTLSDGDVLEAGPFTFRVETNLARAESIPTPATSDLGTGNSGETTGHPSEETLDGIEPPDVGSSTDSVAEQEDSEPGQQHELQSDVLQSLREARDQFQTEQSLLQQERQHFSEQMKALESARQEIQQQQDQLAKASAELNQKLQEFHDKREQFASEEAELQEKRRKILDELERLQLERQRIRDSMGAAETQPEGIRKRPEKLQGAAKTDLSVAKSLVIEGLISRFQADWLVDGCFREFVIGHYRVIDLIDAGGMGWLYLAEDLENHQKVALKVLAKNHGDDAGMKARFELEARAGARLNHPNVIRTHGIDQTDEVFYLSMEFVEGVNLLELIGLQGPVSWQHACHFILQAAHGLQHSHDVGLVHRDVKPANLLIDHEGNLKILDYGLALLDDDEDEFSLAMIFGHDCLGTADYIAPEQSLDSYTVDARADIYSLGCTLYFALTGVVPFPVKDVSGKLLAHRSKKADPLLALAPDVPEQVVRIVDKMMAKPRERRFESATEVAEVLTPFAEQHAVFFDFPSILSARAAVARQRLRLLSKMSRKERSSMVISDTRGGIQPGGQTSTDNR